MKTSDIIREYQKHTKEIPVGEKILLDLSGDPLYKSKGSITVTHIANLPPHITLCDYNGTPVIICTDNDSNNDILMGASYILDVMIEAIRYYIEINENASMYLLIMHYLYQRYYPQLKEPIVTYSPEINNRIDYILDVIGVEYDTPFTKDIENETIIDNVTGQVSLIQ